MSGLCLDSRRCASGEVFCAVRGLQGDGRCHIPEAVARGCVAVIAEESESDIALDGIYIPVPVVKVSQLDRQLSAIAGRFYGNPGNAYPTGAMFELDGPMWIHSNGALFVHADGSALRCGRWCKRC